MHLLPFMVKVMMLTKGSQALNILVAIPLSRTGVYHIYSLYKGSVILTRGSIDCSEQID
jgi:hypothetical protein